MRQLVVPAVAMGDGEGGPVFAWGYVILLPAETVAIFENCPPADRWETVVFVAGGMDGTLNVHGTVATQRGDRLRLEAAR